jgi:hypothetical protein
LERALVRTVVEILAQTGDRAKLVQPLNPIFDKKAAARFDHMVVAHGEPHHPPRRLCQIDMNVVSAGLEANSVLRVETKDIVGDQIAHISAIDLAPVLLHELVADRRWKCYKAVEIVEELQLVTDQIGVGRELAGVGRCRIFGGKAVAFRTAAIGRVERAIEADQPLGDGALGI